jgi:protease-4
MANEQQNKFSTPPPPYFMQARKTRWWIPVLITILVIAFIFIGLIGLMFSTFGSMFEKEPYMVENKSVLMLNFSGKLEERTLENPFDFLNAQNDFTLSEVLISIHRAKEDPRIEGIYIKSALNSMGFAKAREIKDAIEDFKKSGKFVYSYMNWGTELDYYLALSADKIYMPREGVIELNGFSVTSIFFKELFDKIGIDFYVLGFEDFKSAGDMYSRNNFSDSARYQYQVILKQRIDNFIDEIVRSRKVDKQVITDALNRGIYSPDSLLALGLLDSLVFEEDFKNIIKQEIFPDDSNKKKSKKSDNKFKLVSIGNYFKDLPKPDDKANIAESDKQIAIIYASGPLVEKVQEEFTNELQITSKQIIDALKEAREDDDIKVIILRIDSQGGAVLTSDAIYEEILKTKKIKPVYASMSDVAASGGYYIAAPCDTIICHPSTITGSIGVVMAIPNLSKLMKNVYLNVDTISSGPAATQLSGVHPMKEQDKAMLWNMASGVYSRFIDKVALNRKMTYNEVRSMAKGRVWTGEDAYKLGLVDVLGGFDKALALAKKRMGLSEDTKVYIKEFPSRKEPFESLLQAIGLKPKDDEEVRIDLSVAMNKYFGSNVEKYLPAYNSLPVNIQDQLKYMINILQMSENEKVLMALPQKVIIE